MKDWTLGGPHQGPVKGETTATEERRIVSMWTDAQREDRRYSVGEGARQRTVGHQAELDDREHRRDYVRNVHEGRHLGDCVGMADVTDAELVYRR